MAAWLELVFGRRSDGSASITLDSGFGAGKPRRPRWPDLSSSLRYAKEMFDNGLGYYPMLCYRDPQAGERELVPEIQWLADRAAAFASPDLYAYAAQGWLMVADRCRIKGADKTAPLMSAIAMLVDGLALDPARDDLVVSLAAILVHRPQVRDLARAKGMLEAIPSSRRSSGCRRLLDEIARRTGTLELPRRFDYTKLTLFPLGDFIHEQKKCRALIRQLKDGSRDDLRIVLEHFYRLDVLYCLANHASFVVYRDKPRAEKIRKMTRGIARDMSGFTYDRLGRIVAADICRLVSARDEKAFVKHYGATDRTFDPLTLLA